MRVLVAVAGGWRRSALVLGLAHPGVGAASCSRFAWIELIDATTYLNHYWFLTLVAALGVVVPWDGR